MRRRPDGVDRETARSLCLRVFRFGRTIVYGLVRDSGTHVKGPQMLRQSRLRPVFPAAGSRPNEPGRPGTLGTPRAGRHLHEIIRVRLKEQLHKQRVHRAGGGIHGGLLG